MNFGAGRSADILWKCHAFSSSDSELIAAGAHGQPDFLALLHGRRVPVCVYAFDLMKLRGRDLLDQPLYPRRAQLTALLARSRSYLIRFSDRFPDADDLRAECSHLLVKRKDAPYRSGTRSGWISKSAEWKAANQYRDEMLAKKKDGSH